MTAHKEALTLALEALEIEQAALAYEHGKVEHIENAITAIKEALAQPEQEPVAWMYPDALCDKACLYLCTKGFTQFPECATTPPQRTWVGLTDEEIAEIENGYVVDYRIPAGCGWNFAKDIEAKLKEKNT